MADGAGITVSTDNNVVRLLMDGGQNLVNKAFVDAMTAALDKVEKIPTPKVRVWVLFGVLKLVSFQSELNIFTHLSLCTVLVFHASGRM